MKDLGGLGLKLSARSYSYERASILLISEKLEKESHTPRSESGRLFPRHTQHLEFKNSANHVTWVHTQNYLNYEEKESKHNGCGLALRQPRKAQVENVGSGWLEEGRWQRWACEAYIQMHFAPSPRLFPPLLFLDCHEVCSFVFPFPPQPQKQWNQLARDWKLWKHEQKTPVFLYADPAQTFRPRDWKTDKRSSERQETTCRLGEVSWA